MISTGDYEKAIVCFQLADSMIASNATKDRAVFSLNKANALLSLSRYEEAIAAVNSALRLDPGNRSALEFLATVLAEQLNQNGVKFFTNDSFTKALDCFQRAYVLSASLIDDPQRISFRASCLSNQAHALAMLDKFEESLAKANQALALNPTNTHAMDRKAYAEQQLKKIREASNVFNCDEGKLDCFMFILGKTILAS